MIKRNFLVTGLGMFGYETAVTLFEEGANVLAVDIDKNVIDAIKDRVTRAVCCDATNTEAMRVIGAYDMEDAIVAFHDHFDATVLVTHALKRENFQRIVVRVENDSQAEAIMQVGATEVIFPERDIAHRIARKLIFPDLADEIPLGLDFAVLEMPCPPEFVGKSLAELDLRRKYHVTLVGVKLPRKEGQRKEKVRVLSQPDTPLAAGESLLVLGTHLQLQKLKEAVHH